MHIEWDILVVTVFFSILNQIEIHLAQNRKENCHHDHIPFKMKGNGNIVFSVYGTAIHGTEGLKGALNLAPRDVRASRTAEDNNSSWNFLKCDASRRENLQKEKKGKKIGQKNWLSERLASPGIMGYNSGPPATPSEHQSTIAPRSLRGCPQLCLHLGREALAFQTAAANISSQEFCHQTCYEKSTKKNVCTKKL